MTWKAIFGRTMCSDEGENGVEVEVVTRERRYFLVEHRKKCHKTGDSGESPCCSCENM
jgi:hypothetical protein